MYFELVFSQILFKRFANFPLETSEFPSFANVKTEGTLIDFNNYSNNCKE